MTRSWEVQCVKLGVTTKCYLTFQVLTAASMKMRVCWDISVLQYRINWPMFQGCLLSSTSLRSHDGSSKHLWNFGQLTRDKAAQYPRRLTSSSAVLFTDTVDQKYEDESEDSSLHSADGGYKGIHITFPLTKDHLDALIDAFRKKKVGKADTCHEYVWIY
jgi:hypothetical protein